MKINANFEKTLKLADFAFGETSVNHYPSGKITIFTKPLTNEKILNIALMTQYSNIVVKPMNEELVIFITPKET